MALVLAGLVSGVISTGLLYGLSQEKIVTTAYRDGDRFRAMALLLLPIRAAAVIVALISLASIRVLARRPGTLRALLSPVHPLPAYALVSGSNFAASLCQYEALKHVSFTAMTLASKNIAKCTKMVPVMLVGRLVHGKLYAVHEWIVSVLVLAGCAVFITSGSGQDAADSREARSPVVSVPGIALILAHLLLDALTSTTQERLFEKRKTAEAGSKLAAVYNQALYVNAWSTLIAAIGVALTPQIADSVNLLLRDHQLQQDVLLLCLSAVAGQFCLLHIIHRYGAFNAATIMTTKQFSSILANAVAFGVGRVPLRGWAGVGVVFGAIAFKIYMKRRASKPTEAMPPPAEYIKLPEWRSDDSLLPPGPEMT